MADQPRFYLHIGNECQGPFTSTEIRARAAADTWVSHGDEWCRFSEHPDFAAAPAAPTAGDGGGAFLSPQLFGVAKALVLVVTCRDKLGRPIEIETDMDDRLRPLIGELAQQVVAVVEKDNKPDTYQSKQLVDLLVAGLGPLELLVMGCSLLARFDEMSDEPGADGRKAVALLGAATDILAYGIAKTERQPGETVARLYYNLGFAFFYMGSVNAFAYREALDAFQKARLRGFDRDKCDRLIGVVAGKLDGLGWDMQANPCDARHPGWLDGTTRSGSIVLAVAKDMYSDEAGVQAARLFDDIPAGFDNLVEWLAPVARRTCGPTLDLHNDRTLVTRVGWEIVKMWTAGDGHMGQTRCSAMSLRKMAALAAAIAEFGIDSSKLAAMGNQGHPFLDAVDWQADDLLKVEWPTHRFPRMVQAVVVAEHRLGLEAHPWVDGPDLTELTGRAWDAEDGGLEGLGELRRVCRASLGAENGDRAVEVTVECFAAALGALPDPLDSLRHLVGWMPDSVPAADFFGVLRFLLEEGEVDKLREVVEKAAELTTDDNAEMLFKVFCSVLRSLIIDVARDLVALRSEIQGAQDKLVERADPAHPLQLFPGPYLEDLESFMEGYGMVLATVGKLNGAQQHRRIIELVDAFPSRLTPALTYLREASQKALSGNG